MENVVYIPHMDVLGPGEEAGEVGHSDLTEHALAIQILDLLPQVVNEALHKSLQVQHTGQGDVKIKLSPWNVF